MIAIALALAGCEESAATNKAISSEEPSARILDRFWLHYDNNTEVAIREFIYPPSWTAPRHYHNSDLFIYVLDGEFEVTMQHTGKVVYAKGQVVRMEPETSMDARNPSDEKQLKLIVFQVGDIDAQFVVPVE